VAAISANRRTLPSKFLVSRMVFSSQNNGRFAVEVRPVADGSPSPKRGSAFGQGIFWMHRVRRPEGEIDILVFEMARKLSIHMGVRACRFRVAKVHRNDQLRPGARGSSP